MIMIKYLNISLFAWMIVMNYLANALPLNNHTTGQLSDSYPNLFVPAGITFSIWGIIYLLLAGFCIVQFTGPGQMANTNIGWLFALTCILNALWIICWHYEKLPLSLIVMIGLLVALIYINILTRNLQFGIIKASFGIYLGWICIATIANVTAFLVHYNWNGLGLSEEMWSIIMILAGALITIITLYRLNNPFIGLSVIWAFIGIAIKRQNDFRTILITAIIALSLVSIITVWGFIRKSSPGLT
jgi:hypothetical protein